MSPSVRINLALLASTLIAVSLGAQAGPMDGAACSYDNCALRQEGGLIRRGLAGQQVAKIGLFSATDLSAIVRGDSATAYAQLFNHDYRRGARFLWLGLVVTEVPLLVSLDRARHNHSFDATQGALLGVAAGGFVMTELGSRTLRRAMAAASKAIWWHNRELSR